MAKKFTASGQQLKPDPVYDSRQVSKFINCLMWGGKKSVAQKVFYDAMDIIGKKVKDVQPLEVFEAAGADDVGAVIRMADGKSNITSRTV